MVHIYEARANEVPTFAYKFNYAYSYAHQLLIKRMLAHFVALKAGTQPHKKPQFITYWVCSIELFVSIDAMN